MFHASARYKACGRVSMKSIKTPMVFQLIGKDTMVCENSSGFKITVKIPEHTPESEYVDIKPEHVQCTLDGETQLQCEGHMDATRRFIRLDAVDQKDYHWFWFQAESIIW